MERWRGREAEEWRGREVEGWRGRRRLQLSAPHSYLSGVLVRRPSHYLTGVCLCVCVYCVCVCVCVIKLCKVFTPPLKAEVS